MNANAKATLTCGTMMLAALGLAVLGMRALIQDRTPAGECIGLTDVEAPGHHYVWSKRNIIVGVVGVETIILPLYIALYRAKCPV